VLSLSSAWWKKLHAIATGVHDLFEPIILERITIKICFQQTFTECFISFKTIFTSAFKWPNCVVTECIFVTRICGRITFIFICNIDWETLSGLLIKDQQKKWGKVIFKVAQPAKKRFPVMFLQERKTRNIVFWGKVTLKIKYILQEIALLQRNPMYMLFPFQRKIGEIFGRLNASKTPFFLIFFELKTC
jgi:hypothetical protein